MGQNGKKLSTRTKHLYLEAHADAIIADVKALGRSGAARKWGIRPGTISNLLKEWLTTYEIMLIPYMKPGRKC